MAAHRYWRVLLNASRASDNYYSVQEIIMATAVGGATVTTGGTPSYGGTLYSGLASYPFDGTGNTLILYGGGGTACWMQYDFGAGNDKDIVEVGVQCRSDGFMYQCPTQGALAYSDDGVNFTVAFSWSVPEWTYVSEMRRFTAASCANPAPAAFDWANKTASVKLLDSNKLTATFVAVSTAAFNRACQDLTYAEFTITTLTGTPAVGIVTSRYNYAVGTLLGADVNSIGYRSGGAVVCNGVTLVTLAAFAQGDRVDVAFDPINRLIWFRVNGGNWNNSGTANPATLVGGIDYTAQLADASRALLAAGASVTGTVISVNADAPVGTVPSGYGSPSTLQTKSNLDGSVAKTFGTSLAVPSSEITPVSLGRTMFSQGFSPAGPITRVSGYTKEAGVIVSGKKVEVYDRVSGELIGADVSAMDGSWSVAARGRPAVRVVGSDPTTYNSLVYDNVVPV